MKKWIKPQLIVIKRDAQESVLKCCKTTAYAGPQAADCAELTTPCKDNMGS